MEIASEDLPFNKTLGRSIPSDTPHAVSVSLPTWRANVGYEEGEAWVVDKMQCGYPRFFIHKSVQRLAESIVSQYGSSDKDMAMLCPTRKAASHCREWILRSAQHDADQSIRLLEFVARPDRCTESTSQLIQPRVSAVLYPKELWPRAKSFWQHTGEGISSRQAEFCQRALDDQVLVERSTLYESATILNKGPKRYSRPVPGGLALNGTAANQQNNSTLTVNGNAVQDSVQFVEERFGRNLDVKFAAQAKLAVRKRIAGSLTIDADLPGSLEQPADLARTRSRDVPGFSEDDVYLYPSGMNAIFHAHQTLLRIRGEMRSIMFGFPYVDTLKILQNFGPGAAFYGHGNASDLDALEASLQKGERFLSLFCEFPGNPLLKTPDLIRLRTLADKYDFAIVIDETLGNFLNVQVLPHADVVVSSLTKVFSGDSNVMGGAMILNPGRKYYEDIKRSLDVEYDDTQFEEDSIYLERNSRDFVSRIQRINVNAEVIADTLRAHPRIKQVNYPKYSDSKPFYDACRLPNGGYGGLLSATFYSLKDAQIFYDHLATEKGPSLGTNFTLSSPFVLLAHYSELDWAAQYGCEANLIRFSVGLEEQEKLKAIFESALAAIPSA